MVVAIGNEARDDGIDLQMCGNKFKCKNNEYGCVPNGTIGTGPAQWVHEI